MDAAEPLDSLPAGLHTISNAARPICWKWARLWPLFLLLLAAAGVVQQLVFGQGFAAVFDPIYWLLWLAAAAVCTACFSAGPIPEMILFLAGVRSKWVTVVLFTLGAVVAMPSVLIITMFVAFSWAVTNS